MIDKELIKCNTKGEYIDYILKNSKYIRDIDTAIENNILSQLNLNGVEGYFATIYYNEEASNAVRVSDVISLAVLVSKEGI